jgi:hypothetical protein
MDSGGFWWILVDSDGFWWILMDSDGSKGLRWVLGGTPASGSVDHVRPLHQIEFWG